MTVSNNFQKKFALTALSALVIAGLWACKSGGSSGPVMISGAGSTFVYPVMTRWIENFQRLNPNTRINYQSIGSGGGIQQVKAGTVDFGASDAALTDDQLATMKPVIQVPESAGPICLTYNLPGLTKPLQLSPEALAGIFLGKIKTWQDPILVKDNPGVQLPKQNVIVSHRSEGSGTTAIFTTYLAAVSDEWKTKVGKGPSVNWPVGLGGKGSEGVTGQIRQSPGAIGYVELTYAQQNKLPVAAIKNMAGTYTLPTTASTTSAVNAFKDDLQKDPRVPIVNPPASAADAYPISGLTFLILPKDGPDLAKRKVLKQFVSYIIDQGQNDANQLNYAPLPEGIRQFVIQALTQMTAAGQPIQ
jgi:phosphate transport system substrate-binding protein